MLATLLGTIAVASALADGPPPPITVSLNNGGQYNRGEYAKATFQAAADGYVLILQADQDGRIRILFPLDPGDDNFIRGKKTYKLVGRDSRGSFYLDQAGGSGMVYAAWSKSPFRFADFVRGDHWDYNVIDQYNASDDPESQLTDFVLQLTAQDFDYAIDRYIVYSYSDYSSGSTTYIGVSGWPWPTYYTGGWSIGIGFGVGCCYDPWYWSPWYPAYGWGYPAYGWGYPAYGWGYPGYGYGGYYPYYPYYPGYGGGYYPGYGRPGYGYPGYGYAGYRPYTFKPGGTVTRAGNPYRPRGDAFAPQSAGFSSGYRRRLGESGADLGRTVTDAATISGRADAGRRAAARPTTPTVETSRPGNGTGRSTGGSATGSTRRPSVGGSAGTSTPTVGNGGRRSSTGSGAVTPRARSESSPGNTNRARGWSPDGTRLPPASARPRGGAPTPSGGRSTFGAEPQRRSGSGGQARPDAGPSYSQPQGRSPGASPAPRGGGSGGHPSGGGGARPSGGAPSGGGGARGGGGGGGGGRRGR